MEQYISAIRNDDVKQIIYLYYMSDKTINIFNLFDMSRNKINIAKWIISNFKIDNYAIKKISKYGNEELFDWLLILNPYIDLSIDENYCFRKACKYGHITIAKKILEYGHESVKCSGLIHKINIHDCDDYAFINSCYYNKINIALWLCKLCPKFSVKIVNNKIVNSNVIIC
jgi:hypothetical protein